jgi:hypothetical protein
MVQRSGNRIAAAIDLGDLVFATSSGAAMRLLLCHTLVLPVRFSAYLKYQGTKYTKGHEENLCVILCLGALVVQIPQTPNSKLT